MRLLIIEDSVRLQETLRLGFTRAGFSVDVVDDGRKGLLFAKRDHYDVILLDLMLPEMGGLEVLRELRAAGSDAHVLILTARGSTEDRVEGLKLGADDYVSKPFSFDELLARVEALVRRKYKSKASSLVVGDVAIDPSSRRVTKGGVELDLRNREYKILRYLALRQGEVVSRMEIEDHVYGEAKLPESNAVESAVCTIRKKFRLAGGRTDNAIRTVHGVGYCWEST